MAKSKHPVKKAVCIALCALLLYGAVSMLASAVVFRTLFPKRSGLSPLHYTYEELQPDVSREPFAFPSGRNMLSGFRYDAGDSQGRF